MRKSSLTFSQASNASENAHKPPKTQKPLGSTYLFFYYNFLCYELYNYRKNKFKSKKAKTIFGYSILNIDVTIFAMIFKNLLKFHRQFPDKFGTSVIGSWSTW